MIKIDNSWDTLLEQEFVSEYYKKLLDFLEEDNKAFTIYPEIKHIFNAFKLTDYENTKVVILGQDPYHQAGQAHGLCFSVLPPTKAPPSLRNIFKEIEQDLGIVNKSYNLEEWARQGVLLLNTVLTVRDSQANSHKKKGWEIFTDNVIKILNESKKPIVFILWGANARDKKKLLTNAMSYDEFYKKSYSISDDIMQEKEIATNKIHLILEGVHPSPLSAYAGFFGCKHFSKTNEFLFEMGLDTIDWSIQT